MSSQLRNRKGKAAEDAAKQQSKGPASAASVDQGDDEANKGHGAKAGHRDFLESNEWAVALLLLVITAFTRYYRLDRPTGVVFDEFHFGRFTNQYHAGTHLFDIHPPLGKLVLYFVSRFFGYDHTVCSYHNIQDQYGPTCKYYVLRATAAAFGSATSPVLYGIIRGFGGSVRAGVLGALLFTFDGLNTCESRLVLIDSQLIFWCAAALLLAQCWWRRWNRHWTAVAAFEAATRFTPGALFPAVPSAMEPLMSYGAAEDGDARGAAASEAAAQAALRQLAADPRVLGLRERLGWVVAVGVVCANCISIKFTGLATPGMIAVESFFASFFLRRSLPLLDMVTILVVAAATFITYFAVHFRLLPYTGDGDAFMHVDFQRTLVNNTYYDPYAPRPNIFRLVYEANREMIVASARIEQRHHWDSVWWEWIFNLRGVLYYSRDMAGTYTESVYLLGNPLVIWQVLAGMVAAAALLAVYARYRTDPAMRLSGGPLAGAVAAIIFCFISYWLNLLPYLLVKRSSFIYHYMPALVYGEMILALTLEHVVGRRNMHWATVAVVGVAAVGFLIFAPWIYAFPLTADGHARRRWLSRWD